MSVLSYMQRRASGTYEFRRSFPKSLAGKQAPTHMREAFRELINDETGCFKRELVRSLNTKDVKEAKCCAAKPPKAHRQNKSGTRYECRLLFRMPPIVG
jgi:hypothetical protein